MSNTLNKFSTTLVAITMIATMIPVGAMGQTTVDLQAQITALLAQIQALQAQLAVQAPATSIPSIATDLTVGSKGDDVKSLQNYLISVNKGSAAAALAAVGATGFFGSLTRAALGEYQASAGVSPAAG